MRQRSVICGGASIVFFMAINFMATGDSLVMGGERLLLFNVGKRQRFFTLGPKKAWLSF
jgi:hypothetical protein